MAEEKYVRPTWDEYFMEVAKTIAKRATCDRGRSGCVIAKDNQILVTGYVGSPAGLPHCDEAGHLLKKMLHDDGSITQHCVRTVHAEQNALIATDYIKLSGATVYLACEEYKLNKEKSIIWGEEIIEFCEDINPVPCSICMRMLKNTGISRIVNRKGNIYVRN